MLLARETAQMKRMAMFVVAALTAALLSGCQSVFPTDRPGPQTVLVRDLELDIPVVGAQVQYELHCLGPRARVLRNERGQIEIEPIHTMEPPDKPTPPFWPSDDARDIWNQYNQKPDPEPVLNPDLSWNTKYFVERTVSGTAVTGPDGRALLPVIHAPISWRECHLKIYKPGYTPVIRLLRDTELGELREKQRTLEVMLGPLRAPAAPPAAPGSSG
jgi:hypothetical protein